jgi:hypothetical protein
MPMFGFGNELFFNDAARFMHQWYFHQKSGRNNNASIVKFPVSNGCISAPIGHFNR